MVRSLVQGFVLVAALLFVATPAFAGFNVPFNGGACNGVFDPWDSLDAANTFAGQVKCVDLCKATERDCEKYTKDAASCQNNLISDNEDYSKRECDSNPTPESRKSCRQAASSGVGSARDALKLDREEAISDCRTWGDDCVTACTAM